MNDALDESMVDRPADEGPDAAAVAATASTGRRRSMAVARATGGIAAIGVKELRGRMRGRRAFVILTIYLVLLGGFALMVETLAERSFSNTFGQSAAFASASIGQAIFAALLMLMTLQVVFLAPSSTAGAISLEREKQTLELLVTTPIPTFAIVIGKLLSALVYLFLLIAASIPLMAIVFVFGGVAPEDVIRGYIVLLAAAIGLGSFGLFCSSVVKRTQAAIAISIFGVLAATIGSLFVLIFWTAMGSFDNNGNRVGGIFGQSAPAVLAYVNPFIAQADVMCGTESSFGAWCSAVNGLVPSANGGVIFTDVPQPMPEVRPAIDVGAPVPGFGVGGSLDATDVETVAIDVDGRRLAPADVVAVQQFGPARDTVWPKSVATWLILSVIFLFASIQLVSPTRRWRLRRGRRSTDGPVAAITQAAAPGAAVASREPGTAEAAGSQVPEPPVVDG